MTTQAQEQAELFRLQSYYPENVAHNAQQFYYIRSTSLSICGSVAGVLGLTDFSGLYLYIVSLLLINALILLFNAKAKPERYFVQPLSVSHSEENGQNKKVAAGKGGKATGWDVKEVGIILFEGAQENGFSYVLWWTFWFAVVHVYD